MKKKKNAFTLAEVLITLSIIGIIAAIVMPALISSYQYKTVGVKLSKFISTTEDSARAYVVSNDSFSTNVNVMDFVNESFLIKSLVGPQNQAAFNASMGSETIQMDDFPMYYTVTADKMANLPNKFRQRAATDSDTSGPLVAVLKDNTAITVSMVEPQPLANHEGVVDTHKVGLPVFNINFDPKANGLPSTVQKNFNFVVTELGYVFPHNDDECLWDIYDADWVTNAKTFTTGRACNQNATETP